MRKAICVIDGGYGDCGKGLMTDYHVSQLNNPTVVRFNGGAQAGHTVTTPDGLRHVFSHFGSGTLLGAPTYLSEFFVLNPMLFSRELNELRALDPTLDISIWAHPDAIVTTPYDMLLNQCLEQTLGNDRHGSVGAGFGETLERARVHSKLTMQTLFDWFALSQEMYYEILFDHLDAIRREYIPSRIDVGRPSVELLSNDQMIEDTIQQITDMILIVKVAGYDRLRNSPNLVFEGAQGLLLDQDYGHFPHVTRSNCGMRNVSAILNQIPEHYDVTVNYVTRAYTTRHGAGPLANECGTMDHNIIDCTNIHNTWQGALRFAPLHHDEFNRITSKDFALYAPVGATRIDTVTCVDQLCDTVYVATDPTSPGDTGVFGFTKHEFVNHIIPVLFGYASYGPTRDDVVRLTD